MGSGDDPAAAHLHDYQVGLYSFQEIIQPFIHHFEKYVQSSGYTSFPEFIAKT